MDYFLSRNLLLISLLFTLGYLLLQTPLLLALTIVVCLHSGLLSTLEISQKNNQHHPQDKD